MPKTSGAEQDRYEGWFGGDKGSAAARKISERLPQTSGAEQDRYAAHFAGKEVPIEAALDEKLPHASGAEQDRFGTHFSSRSYRPIKNPINATAVGLLQSTVLPSFGFHAGLSAIAYGVSRYTNRVEGKDWLWPSAQVANAWWSAVGVRVAYDSLTVPQAWSTLTYPQKVLLAGVTTWGLRLFYHLVSRGLRRGSDDRRYVRAKAGDRRFWERAFTAVFLPEAAFQTLVSLPFTLPFRAAVESAAASPALSDAAASAAHGLAVFLFGAGFALEVLADTQLEAHIDKADDAEELVREGVWSIVRHPK